MKGKGIFGKPVTDVWPGMGFRRALCKPKRRKGFAERWRSAKAFIGTDSERDTALVFLDDRGRERAKFGLWYGAYIPTLVMKGGDGEDRVIFRLSPRVGVKDRPMILLRDHEGTRVHLGFVENDAPDPKDEDWGTWFYPPHNAERSLAGVGIRRDYTDDKIKGYVFPTVKDGGK
jgi:hypothetical protein